MQCAVSVRRERHAGCAAGACTESVKRLFSGHQVCVALVCRVGDATRRFLTAVRVQSRGRSGSRSNTHVSSCSLPSAGESLQKASTNRGAAQTRAWLAPKRRDLACEALAGGSSMPLQYQSIHGCGGPPDPLSLDTESTWASLPPPVDTRLARQRAAAATKVQSVQRRRAVQRRAPVRIVTYTRVLQRSTRYFSEVLRS